jgi:hypothetical protein
MGGGGVRCLTFRALPTGGGPVGRVRPGSLPGRGGSVHGQASRRRGEACRNPSSRFAPERRGEEKRKIASSWGCVKKDVETRGGWCLGFLWRLGFWNPSRIRWVVMSGPTSNWVGWICALAGPCGCCRDFSPPIRVQFRTKFPTGNMI